MSTLQNDRLIRALLRQPVDRTPVWMMRQAGRYLPEYRVLREKTPDFMTFCKTPELACQATLQPLARFPLDAAIVFSDILTIPDAMGMDLKFEEGRGPVFQNPIRSHHDLKSLRIPDIEKELGYVFKTVSLVVEALAHKIPLIGFSGSPWTLATYMVEGGSSKTFRLIKMMLYQEPKLLKTLLQQLTDIIIAYLNAQIAAGVSAVMVFDTWGGILSSADFLEFSLFYLSKIAAGLTRTVNGQPVPLIFFTKGGGQWLGEIASSGCDAISLDATVDIAQAQARVGDQVALQGNLDPFVLFGKPEQIRNAVERILLEYGDKPGLVFNLGHGIDRETPIENVNVMIEAVHQFYSVTEKYLEPK